MRDGFHSFNTPEYVRSVKDWEKVFGGKPVEYHNPLPSHYQVKDPTPQQYQPTEFLTSKGIVKWPK